MSDNTIISRAVTVVKNGGIIIFPTDTAFGIGCRIDRPDTVDRLFAIRMRPTTQALPVLVSSREQALAYYRSPSDIVRHLMDRYWPGALTIVDYCKKDAIYSPICGGGDSVGIRWPNHTIVQRIIEEVGVPIVGPSANIHGEKTPYSLQDLNPELTRLVDLVVPGICSIGVSSTVVDCTTNPYTIIRQGAISL